MDAILARTGCCSQCPCVCCCLHALRATAELAWLVHARAVVLAALPMPASASMCFSRRCVEHWWDVPVLEIPPVHILALGPPCWHTADPAPRARAPSHIYCSRHTRARQLYIRSPMQPCVLNLLPMHTHNPAHPPRPSADRAALPVPGARRPPGALEGGWCVGRGMDAGDTTSTLHLTASGGEST